MVAVTASVVVIATASAAEETGPIQTTRTIVNLAGKLNNTI